MRVYKTHRPFIKDFSCIKSFEPHNNSVRWFILLPSFQKEETEAQKNNFS